MNEYKAFEYKVYGNGKTMFKHWMGKDSADVTGLDEVTSGPMTFNLRAIKEQLLRQTFYDDRDFFTSNVSQPYQHKQQQPPSTRHVPSKNFNDNSYNNYQGNNSRNNYKHDPQSQNFNTSHRNSTSSSTNSKFPPKQHFPFDKNRQHDSDLQPWEDPLGCQSVFNATPTQAKPIAGESKI